MGEHAVILPLVQIFHALGGNVLFIVKVAGEDRVELVKVEFAE
jgi:hypothetical protein